MSNEFLTPHSLDVDSDNAISHFYFLEDYFGNDEIEQKLEQVNRAIKIESGVYLRYWLLPNSQFWLGIQEARKLIRKRTFPNIIPSQFERPIEIAAKLRILRKSMSSRVWGDLRTNLIGSDYLSPIFFEIDTAAHFWQKGYDIEWCEPSEEQNSQIPEFVIISGNRRIEIECKLKKADTGRKVVRPSFYRLVDKIAKPLSDRRYTGKVKIVVPNRMPTNSEWQNQVSSSVEKLLASSDSRLCLEDGTEITLEVHELGDIVIPAEKTIVEAQKTKNPYSYLAIYAREHGRELTNPLFFELKSQVDDHFLLNVFDELKGANRQFTGRYAALICCFIPEIDSFTGLEQGSALFRMTDVFFHKHARPNVFAVVYSSDAIRTKTSIDVSMSSPAIKIDNPFYNERFGPRINVF